MRTKDINWSIGSFLVIYQLFVIIALPIYLYYYTPSLSLIAISIVLLYLTGFSITGGYHRFYSHRAYRAHPIIETFILFFGSMAGQGSALRWSFEHRLHHAHVDTDEDPYSIKKGFLFAHMLWLFKKPKPIEKKLVADLYKNKFVMFQEKYTISCMIVSNALAVLFVGWLLNDYLGAFMIALWARLFALHHFTWFINSLAHTWGDKPFCQEQTAVDNYLIALLTFGEGYHNYHHTYANDYRNGIRWYHFDPTKWIIWTLSKVGLAWDLKTMDATTIKKRMVLERKDLLITNLKGICSTKKAEIEHKIDEMANRMVSQISALGQLKAKYREFKKQCVAQDMLTEIKLELKNLKKTLKQDWRNWQHLSQIILRNKLHKV